MLQRRVAIVGVVVVVAATLALLIRPPIKEPGLSHELIAMQRAIDDARLPFQGPGFSITDLPDNIEDLADEAADVDLENADLLRSLLDRYGWPTEKMVGREGVRAAFNVVGRARDVSFKEYALGLMRRAGADDNIDYARLVDGVAVSKGEPQTYGTQWTCVDGAVKLLTPLKDPARSTELRRQVGLEPVETFADKFCFRSFEVEDAPSDDGRVAPPRR